MFRKFLARKFATRSVVTSLVDAAALSSIVVGVSMWSPPAGWVAGGLVALGLSVVHA